ncbi:MAG TPA: PAS domain S-box protein, partial [Spirochaetes bacterium]|nr:PAS domain S-box protein [Spirochaetota bacterium]
MNDTARKTILLVEDDVLIAEAEAMTLRDHGYDVLTAHKGAKAVEAALADPSIDLILMDIDLGRGMSGPEAARKILERRGLPIVFLTSHSEREMVDRVREITRYGYIIKNSGDFVLLSSIDMAFDLFEAHEKTREREEKFRLMAENATDIILAMDLEGRFTYASPSVETQTGYTPEEVTGMTLPNILVESYVGPVIEEIARELAEPPAKRSRSRTIEVQFARKDGSILDVEATVGWLIDDRGETIGIQGNARDITERKRAENRMRMMSEMLDTAPGSITVHDHGGRFLFANEKTFEIHGYARDEFMALNLSDIDVPESTALFDERVRLIMERGEASFEVKHIHKDGSIIPMEVYAKKVDWLGTPALLSIATDITERKRAEEALETERAQMLSVFDSLDEVIYVTDMDTYEILFANKKIQEIFNKPMVGGVCYREIQRLDAPCPFCTNDIIRKMDYRPYRWEYYNPVVDRHYQITDRVIRWPDGRDVRFEMAVDITDRKRVEEKLKFSESLLRTIMDTIPSCIYLKDFEGKYLFSNEFMARLYGTTTEEMLGKTDVYYSQRLRLKEEEALAFIKDDQDVIRSKQKKFVPEEPFTLPDGSVKWFQTIKTPLELEDGSEYLLGVSQDITNRKLFENELDDSLDRNRAMLSAIPDLMFVFDRQGVFLDHNPFAGADMTVMPPEQFMNKPIGEIMPPDIASLTLTHLDLLFETGEEQVYGYSLPFGGEIRHYESRMVKYGEEKALAIVRDITDRKKADETLKESEERFRTLFEQANDAILLHDFSGNIHAVNASARRRLGYTEDELLSMTIADFDPDFIARDDMRRFWTSLPASIEGRNRRKDGSMFPVEIRLSEIHYRDQHLIMAQVSDITDRRKAEEALHRSEERYRRLVESSDDLIFSVDRAGVFQTAGGRRLKDYGLTPEDLVGKSIESLAGGDAPMFLKRHDRVFESGEPYTYEHTFEYAGVVKTDQTTIYPIRDAEGRVEYVGVLCRDITTRKKIEDTLVYARDEWERIFDAMPDLVCIIDPEHRVVRSNRAFAERLGMTPGETAGKTCYELVHDTGTPPEFCPHVKTMADGNAHSIETEEIRLGGIFQVTTTPLYGPDGALTGSVHVARDMSERVKIEEALRESEEKYRLLIEHSHDIIYTLNPDGIFTFVSPAWTSMLGHPVDAVEGRHFTEFIHPDDHPACFDFMRLVIESGRRQEGVEYRVKHADGSWLWHTT